jgi:ABC-2 type transport system permease protein
VVFRELERMSSRPLYLVVCLVLPLVSFGLLWAIFHEGVPRDLPVAVFAADRSALSRRVVRMIDASPTLNVVDHVTDLVEGHGLIQAGRVYALVALPRNLEKDVLVGRASPIVNYHNNANVLVGSLVSRAVREVVGTVSAGVNLRRRQKHGEMADEALGHLAPIRIESHALFNPYTNFQYFLVAALLPTMLQIFVLTMSIYVVGVELKEGTAKDWLRAAGGSTWKAATGKLLPYTLVFVGLGMLMLSLLFGAMGLPLRGNAAVIVVATVLMVLAYQLIGLLLVAVTANVRLALSFGAFYASTAFAFVGLTYPILGMPLVARAWSGILPLTHYLRIFVDQALKGVPLADCVPPVAALVGFLVLAPVVPAWRFRKLMTEERFWGRI